MALGYKIALTNVWWKRGGQDIRLFANTTEQQTYFSNLGLYWNDLVNFNMNDNITTTITFKDKSGRDAETLLKCNYAVVWNTLKSTYRYYFIVSIAQDSYNQVIVSLDLDDVNTNLVANLAKNWSVFVERWTGLNYVYDGNDTFYKFNDTRISYMPQGDAPLLKNIGTNEVKIKQYNDTTLDNWLFDNIDHWEYIFLVENNQLLAPKIDSNQWAREGILSNCYINELKGDKLPYGAISVPIYRKNSTKRIYVKYNYNSQDYYLFLAPTSFYAFFNTLFTKQGDDPKTNAPQGTYGIERKSSNICPLKFYTYSIDADGDIIIEGKVRAYSNYEIADGDNAYLDYCYFYLASGTGLGSNTTKANAQYGIISGYNQNNSTYEAEANHDLPIAPLVQNNVKFFDNEYSRLRVRIGSQGYDYTPLLLINSKDQTTIDLQYTEVLKVGVSKIYLRAKSSGKYSSSQQYDYTGLVASLDLTEPLLTNQWADYLASHKNYYMQTAFNNTIGLVRGGFKSMASEDTTKGSALAVDTMLTYVQNVKNQYYDRDDMMHAPNQLSNANGDPYFNISVDGIRPKLDSFYIMSNQDAILSNWEKYGVLYNRGFTLGEVINKHYKYDALSCIIDVVVDNMSNKEYDRLKSYMSKVHRYWHVETDTLGENYYIL